MAQQVSVDSMLALLKGMQRERTCLQDKLKETRMKKQILQSQVRGMNLKHNQSKETNAKLKETLNVAQAMLDKSQKEQREMQEEIENTRGVLESVSKDIEKVTNVQLNHTTQFENRLSTMADRFIKARKFYMEDSLEKEVNKLKESGDQLIQENSKFSEEAKALTEEIRQLQLDNEVAEKEMGDLEIDAETQNRLLGELTHKNRSGSNRLTMLHAQTAQLGDEDSSLTPVSVN